MHPRKNKTAAWKGPKFFIPKRRKYCERRLATRLDIENSRPDCRMRRAGERLSFPQCHIGQYLVALRGYFWRYIYIKLLGGLHEKT